MRLLCYFLALGVLPAYGQTHIQSDLIDAPDRVDSGSTFLVTISGDLPYQIVPQPKSLIELLDRRGNVVLFITAGQEALTISVNQHVVHPTAEEIQAAPWDDRDAFATWLADNSRDDVYQDTHVVKMGSGPPPPGPKPPDDPLARKVYEAAIQEKLPRGECQSVSKNIRAVLAQAVATSMTLEEMQQQIKKRNIPITSDDPAWDRWEAELPKIFTVSTKPEAIDAYEKIALGLEAVQ